MNPLRIEGATHTISAPGGVKTIREVPVKAVPAGTTAIFVTRWEPTPTDLAILLSGGCIEVCLVGRQPPMLVGAVPHPALVHGE